MEELKQILTELKNMGCCGIKVSFEDEGALYNEIISMRSLTKDVGLDLSVKIGGCEAKRDITDCIDRDPLRCACYSRWRTRSDRVGGTCAICCC